MKRYVVPTAIAAVLALSGTAFAQFAGKSHEQTAEVPPVEKPVQLPSSCTRPPGAAAPGTVT